MVLHWYGTALICYCIDMVLHWYRHCTDMATQENGSLTTPVPRPHLSWEGSHDNFLVVPSQQSWFQTSNGIVPHHPSVCVSQWNRPYVIQACNQCSFKINTADSAQPRNHSIVTRPFSSCEVGSGHETILEVGAGRASPQLLASERKRLAQWPVLLCSLLSNLKVRI